MTALRWWALVWLFAMAGVTARGVKGDTPAPELAGLEFFEKKVRPLLVEKCYDCHSARAKKVRGGLLLDSREAMTRGGDTGPAVVPGDLDESLLIAAVRQTDPSFKMPPKGKLTETQVADL